MILTRCDRCGKMSEGAKGTMRVFVKIPSRDVENCYDLCRKCIDWLVCDELVKHSMDDIELIATHEVPRHD